MNGNFLWAAHGDDCARVWIDNADLTAVAFMMLIRNQVKRAPSRVHIVARSRLGQLLKRFAIRADRVNLVMPASIALEGYPFRIRRTARRTVRCIVVGQASRRFRCGQVQTQYICIASLPGRVQDVIQTRCKSKIYRYRCRRRVRTGTGCRCRSAS